MGPGNPDFDAQLEAAGVTFERRDADLLWAVDEHGSLNSAAEALGRSFSHAQRRVVELEEAFGPLVDRRRGGSGGGGSTLTANAEGLLARFDRLRAGFAGVAEADETALPGTVVARDGELATVETAAGRVLALVPPDVEDVQVSVRADTVTLNAPDDAPEPEGTSARNRFSGTVTAVDEGRAVARVAVDVGADAALAAIVTLASVEKLGLRPGDDVVASFKATATRGVPA